MRRHTRILRTLPAIAFGALICGCTAIPEDQAQNAGQPAPSAFVTNEQQSRETGLNAVAADLEAHGGRQTALALYQNAALTSGDAASIMALGDAYARAGMTKKSIDTYRLALQKEPSNPAVMAALGLALVKCGKADEGVPFLQKAAPSIQSAAIYANLGAAQLLSGNPKAAAESLDKALDLAPTDLDIATNLALAQALSGQTQASVNLMRKVVRSAKANSRHRSNFVLVLALAGLTDEAKGLAQKDLPETQIDALIKRAARITAAADDKARAKILGTSG